MNDKAIALKNANWSYGGSNHFRISWITDVEATVFSPGSKYKKCTECREILEIAQIPQLKAEKPNLKSIENTQVV